MPEHAVKGSSAPPSLKDADWLKRPETGRVFAALGAPGVETRAVGGAVRNALLGLPVTEIDLATTAPPDKVMTLVREAGLKAVPTGIVHGTVTVIAGSVPFEVTTLRRDVETFGRQGVGVAHCPTSNMRLGAGIARVRDLLEADVQVGLGVDGSASNERSDLFMEVKQALLVARARGGPQAMNPREALRLGTRGGAAVLGRADIGQLSPGKRADVAVWRTDGLELGGADDLVAGLVFSGPHRVDRLYVGGDEVVRDGHLVRADESEIAKEHRVQAERFVS